MLSENHIIMNVCTNGFKGLIFIIRDCITSMFKYVPRKTKELHRTE